MNASTTLRAAVGVALTASALMAGAVTAQAAAAPVGAVDTRATPSTGAPGDCKSLGFDGDAYGVGVMGVKDAAGKVSTARGKLNKDVYLDITKAPASGVITAAAVVNSLGYNFFHAGETPDAMGSFPIKGLTGPVAKGTKKLEPITGWFVCIAANGDSIGHTQKGVDRKTPMEMCPLGSALTPEQLCTRPM
jgi:hypothetical protein